MTNSEKADNPSARRVCKDYSRGFNKPKITFSKIYKRQLIIIAEAQLPHTSVSNFILAKIYNWILSNS